MSENDILHYYEYIEYQNAHRPPLRLLPRPKPQPRQIDHLALDKFEGLIDEYEAALSMEKMNDYDFSCLSHLPHYHTALGVAEAIGSKYNAVLSSFRKLQRLGLARRVINRQFWPTIEGFKLLGIEPLEPRRELKNGIC